MHLAHERRGSGEPLVLIHGIGSQWQVWTPVLDRLAAAREVIAIDLPGFGDSPALDGEAVVTPERFAAVVSEFLAGLGLDSAHLAGNSLGGGISLELARIGRARSVTCLSPIGFWNDREHVYARSMLQVTRALARALQPVAGATLGNPPGRTALMGHLAARPWRISAQEAVDSARNLAQCPGWQPALDGMDRWRVTRSEDLHCPVTIAWGARDMLLIPRQGRRARRVLSQAQHVTLTGCGHVPTWDDPEQVAQTLLAGSARRSAPAGGPAGV